MSAIKDFVTKRKKPIAIVLVIAIAGGAFFVFNPFQSQPTSGETALTTRTVTLEETSLIETLNVSGTVESTRIVNVTTTSQEKVTEIFVQVGDYVAIGDAIVQLDTTDINEQIADEQERIAENREDLLKALNDAVEAANDAHTDAVEAETDRNEAQVFEADVRDEYERAVAAAAPFETAYNTANAYATTLEQDYQIAYDAYILPFQTEVDNATTALQTANAELEQAKAAAAADPTDTTLQDAMDAKQTALDTAAAALNDENAKLQTAIEDAEKGTGNGATVFALKAVADAARAQAVTAQQDLNNVNVSGFLTTLTNAEKATESAQTVYESKLDLYDAALDKQETAQENYSEANESATLENLLEQQEDSTIRSETNGVITELNAIVGSSMSSASAVNGGSSPVAVIQDTDSLIITTSFLQFDVSEIYVGQDVIITSDATGDVEYSGKISQVSMTADTTSDGTPAFSAEIAVNSGSELLIGMSAKASVVIFEKNDIITVPFDAVGKDENGNDIVYRLEADGSYVPVTVTVGDGNDYEVEISGAQINVGDVIRASAIAEDALMMSGTESMMFNMGTPTTGGAPTGGGPAGGGSRG